MMKRKVFLSVAVTALALNFLLGARTYSLSKETDSKDTAYPNLELFSTVLERVRRDYVDGADVTYDKLVRNALRGMVGELDPHSEFLEPKGFQDLQDDTQGAFGGVGVVVSPRDGFLTVVAPSDESPAFKAGIKTGDRILKVNGRSAERMTVQDAVGVLRGEPGTEVTLTIERPSTGQTLDFPLKRAQIKVDMVKDLNNKRDFRLGEDKIGYIRLVQFGEKTGAELDDAIKRLRAQGMTALVLDLRWNPGGLLDQAVEVCQKFLPKGQLVVTTKGRRAAEDMVRRAGGRGDLVMDKDGKSLPMVVLVNGGSASASEIVAGCLQDTKRALVVGETSFGKGSVQSVIPLPDGSALRLTTAKYYTPSEKVIHEHGVTPDIVVPATEEENNNIQARRVPGGLDSLEPAERERLSQTRDPQLDRAVDLLKALTLLTERNPSVLVPASVTEKMARK
jgi:carboxyl-terminal processing protease